MTVSAKCRLPAEWEPQDAVLVIWPPQVSDWTPWLIEVEPVFIALVTCISHRQRVLLVCEDFSAITRRLVQAGADLTAITPFTYRCNDTWARDCAPIAVETATGSALLDFAFNGWGLKFPADRDNQLGRFLYRAGLFQGPMTSVGLVLEGGSIDSDGQGSLLSTRSCLLESNRNPHCSEAEISAALCSLFGAERVLLLDHGQLAGDDTDGHVDTLARFAPGACILYQGCNQPGDEHAEELAYLEDQLRGLRTLSGQAYQITALPMPVAIYSPLDGRRLPASYANFLVINDAVLVPTYRQPLSDAGACEIIGAAFPEREVIGIDCLPLLLQGGSLHCLSMHYPRGILANAVGSPDTDRRTHA